MKPTLKIDFWISNVDSRAHSWPCRPVPARFQLTATYWHKNQSFEHALTIDLGRSVPISSTIRVACSLCKAKQYLTCNSFQEISLCNNIFPSSTNKLGLIDLLIGEKFENFLNYFWWQNCCNGRKFHLLFFSHVDRFLSERINYFTNPIGKTGTKFKWLKI